MGHLGLALLFPSFKELTIFMPTVKICSAPKKGGPEDYLGLTQSYS